MAYIVTREHFIKELSIPSANFDNRDIKGGNDTFDMYMDKEARELLGNALNFTLFSDLDSYVDVNGVLSPTAPQKWLNLVNGKTYTKDGVDYRWKGLIYEEGAFKGSVLAYYVYCKWLEYQVSQLTIMGEKRGEASNTSSFNSTYRLTNIWNEFVSQYQGDYVNSGIKYYLHGVPVTDYAYSGNKSQYVSLLQFLIDNETDYPDAGLKLYEYKNSFGI